MPEPNSASSRSVRAIFDIGSNAVKFTALSFSGKETRELFDLERITRLAAGLLEDGNLGSDSVDRTVEAANELLAETGFHPQDADAVGTWIFRNAGNAKDVAKRFREETGLRLRIFSESEEASAGFVAARGEFGDGGPIATLDHGGGSTDLAWGSGPVPAHTLSLPIGARRLARRIPLSDPPTFEEINRVRYEARSALEEIAPLEAETRLVLIGGAAAAFSFLARHFWPGSGERAQTLTPEALDVLLQKLGRMTLSERKEAMAPRHEERADVIVHSAAAMREIIGGLGQDTAYLSLRGVGHGVLLSDRHGIPLDLDAPKIVLSHTEFRPLNRSGRRGEVLFALVRDDGSVWLQRKVSYPEGVFRLPGGGIDKGESPAEAVLREMAEETGLEDARPHIIGRITYRKPDSAAIDFHSDLFLVFSGEYVPTTKDKHEDVAAWLACPHRELLQHENNLLHLDEPRSVWGTFRAAALAYLRTVMARHVL